MGMDGISLWLVVLTTFLTPLCVLISWKSIHDRVKEFFILLLILETALIGVFTSLDLFLFYFFWEATLIPMALLIGVFGHERKVYAAVKFFMYTMIASVFMLAAILWLYAQTGSFDFVTIRDLIARGAVPNFPAAAQWLFLGFFLAFAVKVPLFPFHTWLPDAHVEAPTAGSVLLAGVLLKMGTYGMLRFNLGLFPEQARHNAPWIMTLALIGIIYGALVAMVQPNMKKLIAYSSISHLGFVVLGIFSFTQSGLNGAMFVMLAHGISTGGLFMLAGILHERRHTYEISEFGGLAFPCPFSRPRIFYRARLARTSFAQRIHRRVPGPERRIPGKAHLRNSRRDRRDLERRLSLVDVSARLLRQSHEPGEQFPERSFRL
jgi:NADH-quinone oxidoreductase subunit M